MRLPKRGKYDTFRGLVMGRLLDQINSPEDMKDFTLEELNLLCGEIRQKIIETVSANGGHLASNLGVVELTVALHKVFHVPEDQIVWDVGHQCYTHKILTGRREQIETIRTQNGLSGYPNHQESEFDPFNSGHSSTSISVALGLANAKKFKNDPGHVVAVIGDGALTGGLAYEGLNNAGRFHKNFIVILNDNKMSISRNVGSMARYLAYIRTKPGYLKMKGNVENTLNWLPVMGKPLHRVLKKSKSILKQILYNSTIFEDMGFAYYGPFDGHDVGNLLDVLENAKKIDHPVLIHVLTSKGKGYPFAEKNPGAFHGISSFDVKTGETGSSGSSFSDVFGADICRYAKEDPSICAITAAMQLGTGLSPFKKDFPDRFFDVGIAEEHAITFAGGLAAGGMLPVCAIYSTFLQRSYDQIIHDAALQNLHLVLAVDRAGVVGEDGETHQGIFDVPFLNTIPNVSIYAPAFYDELHSMLQTALYREKGVVAVRYPRGKQLYKPAGFSCSSEAYSLWGEETAPICIVTYGRTFSFACLAVEKLREKGISARVLKLNRIKPIPQKAVIEAINAQTVFFFEESILQGGTGEQFGFLLSQGGFSGKYHLSGIDGCFVKQASMQQTLAGLGLDAGGIYKTIVTECGE